MPGRSSVDAPVPAIAGHIIGTSASESDVVVFYLSYLTEHGWAGTNLTAERSSIEASAVAWKHGTVIFRLSFLAGRDGPRLPSASDQGRFPTIFRAQLIDHSALEPSSPLASSG